MEYRYIGRSGLRVSPICMGTMTFGTQTPDEKVAFAIMDKAYNAGVNFFDTAELYHFLRKNISKSPVTQCMMRFSVRWARVFYSFFVML